MGGGDIKKVVGLPEALPLLCCRAVHTPTLGSSSPLDEVFSIAHLYATNDSTKSTRLHENATPATTGKRTWEESKRSFMMR